MHHDLCGAKKRQREKKTSPVFLGGSGAKEVMNLSFFDTGIALAALFCITDIWHSSRSGRGTGPCPQQSHVAQKLSRPVFVAQPPPTVTPECSL